MSGFSSALGVSAFYVSFVVAPLASNASEIISAIIFAGKKRRACISVTFAGCLGAATMNSTLVLGVFLFLIAEKGIKWTFSAEVIAILTVTLVVGIWSCRKQTFKLWEAIIPAMVRRVLISDVQKPVEHS
ncbi:hypothetical protein KIPB_013596, partial [Kipferlia bialata]|eukprot:g13596.t1